MKKATLYIVASLAFFIGTSYIIFKEHLTYKDSGKAARQLSSDDVDGYYEWQQKRLADPATGKIPDNIHAKELAYAATLPTDANSSNERIDGAVWASRGPWNIGGRTLAGAAEG